PECRAKLGHFGCLETMASPQAMLESLNLDVGSQEEIRRGLAELGRLATQGDSAASDALAYSGDALGKFIATVIATNDPGRVVIYADEKLADDAYRSAQIFQHAVDAAVASASSKDDRIQ